MAKYSKEAFIGIIEETVKSVDGVAQIKNVKANLIKETKEIEVDVYILVSFGVKIPEVAWSVQNSIKKSFENIESINFNSINIHVCGVKG